MRLARSYAGALGRLEPRAALAAAAAHSVAGLRRADYRLPPLHTPHHTASAAALQGSTTRHGRFLPGEYHLARHGVLALHNLPEFDRAALDTLTDPLTEGVTRTATPKRTLTVPARFLLLATRGHCPCDRRGDESPVSEPCRCSPREIESRLDRIPAALAARFETRIALTRAADGSWRTDVAPGAARRG